MKYQRYKGPRAGNIVPQNNMADEQAKEVPSLTDEKQPKTPGDSKKSKKVCFFYARNKRCKFGDKCRFVHSDEKSKTLVGTSGESPENVVESSELLMNENEEISAPVSSEITISVQEITDDIEGIANKPCSNEDLNSNQKTSHDDLQTAATEKHDPKNKREEAKKNSKQRCRFFFTKAGCARGDACKFSHEKPKNNRKQLKPSQEESLQNKEANDGPDKRETENTAAKLKSSERQNKRTITRVVPTSTRLSMLDNDEVKKLRTRELNQVERGFGKLGLKTVNENNETTCYINFTPSDPDWPFDVEVILLAVTFPEDYPKVMFRASLSEEQDLPLELIRFTNKGISRWLEQQQAARNTKDTVDLPFRPFLRWLDRNIEELFIEAAREMKKNETAADMNGEESQDINESHSEEDSSGGMEMKNGKGKDESQRENMDPNKIKDHHKGITEKKSQQKQKRRADDQDSYSSSERKELLLSDFLTFKKPTKNKGSKGAVSSKGSHGDRMQTEDSPKDHIVFVDQDMSLKKGEDQMLEKVQSASDLKDEDGDDGINFGSYKGCQIDDMPRGVPLKEPNVGNNQHRGTEIRFKGLELSENTSTLTTDCVTLMMECLKCKTKTDFKVEKTRSSAIRCDKCSSVLRISFRPAIIHQFSSTLGYLDLEGWHPFDLIMPEMQVTAGCLACSHETTIKGPHYGANQVWCSKCHQKLAFKVESTRFFELTPTGVQDKNDVMPEKPKKKPKAPGLKEGFPLPDNGTCKHYKKSYRWLRFPCCGKCYPCDVCHEEHEDHEFKFANRMVCGFCSKEQPYSQSVCVACNSATTKARSSHWEGGKGCRNKSLMNRGDDKKYKNTMKTTSRKAQAKDTPKAKAK